ncbi:SusC/RagA family TonB-linked outer membrane protein [Bacteroidales bacterium]|nr:SusC/RagA family TonB-linked outer membrane protein [Bacteroidales bacterium]
MKRTKNHLKNFLRDRYFKIPIHLFAAFFLIFGLASSASAQTSINIKGIVFDETGESLPGAGVYLKSNNKVGTVTNTNGEFVLSLPSGKHTLIVSFIGMEQQEVHVEPNKLQYTVKLKDQASSLQQVVVTGIAGTRSKATFTGATAMVTGEELKSIGNQNVLQSLRSLDPSFVMVDNSMMGSDPNTMGKFEVRGQSGVNISSIKDGFSVDPNQPLFILDGFETTLQIISDLDINRIASITILKDAGSTAIYGSKASNGVVVVETIKPKEGTVRVSYNADLSLNIPDLSSYNMMNSAEKLEFERLSGRYDYKNWTSNTNQAELDQLYYYKLYQVERGVDTYWLKEPVKTGFNNAHSLNVSGGTESILFDVGVSYRNNDAVMKGSLRESWGGNVNLTYRKDKLNITNSLTINGVNSQNSPYGEFSTWANTNPYYTKHNEYGEVAKYLERRESIYSIYNDVYNPLYNALLNSSSGSEDFNVVNNLQFDYRFSADLRLSGGLGLKKGFSKTVDFIAPENTKFDNSNIYEKGSYSNADITNSSYSANMMLSYAKLIGQHQIYTNMRGEIAENQAENISLSVVGFPYGTNGSPSFSYGYPTTGRPGYATSKNRSANILYSLNYSYNQKYLFDATYRLDGSTTFGSKEKFNTFWSLGTGWNIHEEAFMNKDIVNNLKVRGSYGTTGNQNVGGALSSNIYGYYTGGTLFGIGQHLTQLGNQYLKWQQSKQLAIGTDMAFMKNRLTLVFDVYTKKTDPSIITLSLAPSTGITDYPTSLGYLETKGAEVMIAFSPIYNRAERIIWTLRASGAHNKSTYGGFGDALSSLNQEIAEKTNENKNLERYTDGYSPNDLWAVRSVGIDPATGKEVFLTKDGVQTFNWNIDDRVRIGNLRPDMEGILGTSFTWKNFSTSLNFRYSLGGKILNTALYNKIENINVEGLAYNQDKRALYDRWQNPGDVSEYKAISMTSTTPISSRFIQKNNYLSWESANISWDLSDQNWVIKTKLQGLRFSIYTNDILRISTSKVERGIDYPYARTVSFSMRATL